MPNAAGDRRRDRSVSLTLGTLAIGSFATGTDSFVIAGVLPDVASDLGASVTAVGVTVAVFAVAYALGGPVLVASTARAQPRRILVASMCVFVIANVAAAAAPNVAVLGVARVVAALGAGVFVPTAIAVAARIGGEDRRARSTAVVVGGASSALVLGAPLGTLVAKATSWRGSFALIAAIGVVAVVGVARQVSQAPATTVPTWSQRRTLLTRPDIFPVLAVTIAANTAAFAVYPYLGVLFPDASSSGIALLVFAFGAGAVVGTWAGGRVADAAGATATVAVVVSVFALDHALLGVVAGSTGLGVAYALVWGLSGWATVPAQQSRLIGRTGPLAPLALSLNSSAIHLGTGIGALAGAAVIGTVGAEWIWVVATLAALIALAFVPLGERHRRTVDA